MGTNDNNTRAHLQLTPVGARRAANGIRTDALPRALFVAAVIARGLGHIAQDSFRGLSPPAKLSELASAVLVRANHEANEVEAFLRLPGGELALVDTGYGQVRIEVAKVAVMSATARLSANDSTRSRRTTPLPSGVPFSG